MTGASPSFPDHFSSVAAEYAAFRPDYPLALFEWLAGAVSARSAVWDCACGSGQATARLAERFDLVIATDGSHEQLSHAPAIPRTIYQLATAEESGLPTHSVDAVVVAQALHWFDLTRFWPEVRRVVRPGGVVAAWSYALHQLDDPDIDEVIRSFYDDVVGPWWPANRRHVDSGYATLDFPFVRLTPPVLAMEQEWEVSQMLGYLRSWSATQRYRTHHGIDPVIALAERLAPLWGAGRRMVRWPLAILAGVVEGGGR